MKLILNIVLSFILFASGIPVTEQAQPERYFEAEGLKEAEAKKEEKESEVPKKGETEPEERVQRNTYEGRERIESRPGNEKEEVKEADIEGEVLKRKKTVQEKLERKELSSEDTTGSAQKPEKKNAGKTETEKGGGRPEEETAPMLEAGRQERAEDAALTQLNQNDFNKILFLLDDETLEKKKKTGYTLTVSQKVACNHNVSEINGSIKCSPAAIPLNPTKSELLNNVTLTGVLKKKKFTKSVEKYDAGGINNTVSHLRLNVKVDAPGIKERVAAEPYVCAGDGYAGYAYFEQHYTYCPNTEKYYPMASSHVWLGCTRNGGEIGENEFHFKSYKHEFDVYRYVPNKYQISYKANGGAGTIKDQKAVYDKSLVLNDGERFSRTGYKLAGWNTKKDGSGTGYELDEMVKNLTAVNEGTVTLYAQWVPNVLRVSYDGNGGKTELDAPEHNLSSFVHKWNYKTTKQKPEPVDSFGLSKSGYSIKKGSEWNTKPDGTGTSFDQSQTYAMTSFAPNLGTGDQSITLYAQWEPNVYTVTLDREFTGTGEPGTEKLYKKYETGIFFDSLCSREVGADKIVVPQKTGYQFKGFYDARTGGRQMVNAAGELTKEGKAAKNTLGDETWYACCDYLIGCEDYADIPCDIQKTEGDIREELGIRLTYDSDAKKVVVYTGKTECSISLTGKASGAVIGKFQSSVGAGSASGATREKLSADLYLTVLDGTAYQLKAARKGQIFCNRLVYFKNGRFRTLAKLGVQKAKEAAKGSSLKGSHWNQGDSPYDLYQYYDCSELNDIKGPGMVQRYFHYKEVNMAYSGNGATSGSNLLEYDVSLENFYQFQENSFVREERKKKYTRDKKEYECKVRYSFQGWEMGKNALFREKQQEQASVIYHMAEQSGAVLSHTAEEIGTYQVIEPVSPKAHSPEYINFQAKWDAFPTIVVTPGDKLEFYEGEKVTKEMLIRHLTAHDEEDNENSSANDQDLNGKLRIVKISYPEPKNHSQAAYEKTYEKDVPSGFLLDTYYLKLEKNETVDVLVTFAVTDSAGNTTEEEFSVKVKYNNYPKISSENVFYYLKEEANRGEITAEALIQRASAKDQEDGDITDKLSLKEFDPQAIKMQTEVKGEFIITYQVTDSYQKTAFKEVKLVVWDDDGASAEMPRTYVRYISDKYLDTLEEHSVWRKPENLAYLKNVLRNKTPVETWIFTHEDVLAVQNWITQGGDGRWKIGKEANQKFLEKFSRCRQ